jgi:nitrile hydratase
VNGAQDMGGAHGYGAIELEADEPVFHAEWERRVFALTRALGAVGEWNLDQVRFAREDRPPAQYLSMSYYERWLAGLERLLVERGLVGTDEFAAGRSLRPGKPVAGILGPADVATHRPTDPRRDPPGPARFAPGDQVRALNIHPAGHTRLPRFVRGCVGTVASVHGAHVFPDSNAHGQGERPQWLYTVCFEARALWGSDADPAVTVSVDAFEPYLTSLS